MSTRGDVNPGAGALWLCVLLFVGLFESMGERGRSRVN